MRQQFRSTIQSFLRSLNDCPAEVISVPIDNDGRQQVKTRQSVVLCRQRALPADTKGIFQSMMCFAFVQSDLSTALHVNIEQPVDNKERALDAANLPKGNRQIVLTRKSACKRPRVQ